MKSFNDYVETAIKRQGFRNTANLAREIDISKGAFSQLVSGKNLPKDDTMVKIAELAGLPKEEALLTLNIWRAERGQNPDVKKIWERMSKMIAKTSLVAVFCFVTTNSYAGDLIAKISTKFTDVIYYVYLC